MTTIDDALAPYARQEIHDITTEVRLIDMNIDELLALLGLMTAVRERVRDSKVVSAVRRADSRPALSLVRPNDGA